MSEPATTPAEVGNRKTTTLVVSLIVLAVVALLVLIFSTEPNAERGGAVKKTPMLVEVETAKRGAWRPQIVAQGMVQASQDVVLRPQVAGRVIRLSPELVPGGIVRKGDRLLWIESADFENTLAERQSDLQQALSELAIEKGRQDAARSEVDFIDEELSAEEEALVLRRPQLAAAEQRVAAARAAVEQARLELSRTTVRAPFDAHVVRRDVNVGSIVSSGESLGRLLGLDEYWVAVELPLAKLRWVALPDGEHKGALVRVQNPRAWPRDALRRGHLFRLVRALDETTRMARVLAAIPDPLARSPENQGQPPLMVGEFLDVTIDGVLLEDVVRLDRDLVRQDDTVWLMEDSALVIRPVEVLVRDAEHAYIGQGLEEGDRVVTTNLATVVAGAALRIASAAAGTDDGE